MEEKLVFLRLSESNIDLLSEGLSELYFTARRKRRDPAFWRWYYLCGPFGKNILIVALRGNQVVGMYGLLRVLLSALDNRVAVGLMADFYIHPLEKSWVCYCGLIENNIAEAQKEDLEFRFGIAPSGVTKLYRNLGVISIGRVPVYLGFRPILDLSLKRIKKTDLEIRSLENFDKDFDMLGNTIAKSRAIAVVKNATYLNWRYSKFSGSQFVRLAAYRGDRLEGLVVLCYTDFRYGNFILELMARDDNPETMKQLLFYAVEAMRDRKIGYITASFPAARQLGCVLEELSFKTWGAGLWHYPELIVAGTVEKSYQGLGLADWDFSLGDWMIY